MAHTKPLLVIGLPLPVIPPPVIDPTLPNGSCAGQLLAFDGAANVWAKIVTDASSSVVVGRNGDVVLGVNC